jgi:nitrogenase molybdenum-iron protein alpha/beta subunit
MAPHSPHRAFPSFIGPRFCEKVIRSMVELSGIEPLTSSLRIQGATLDSETPDDTE